MTNTSSGHDIIVMGASAGGVQALTSVVAGLSADFFGSVFVVLHVPAEGPSALASILGRAGALPAVVAQDGEPVQPGCIYVAQPNRHLVLRDGHIRVEAGPRENSARPSVDVLFRSAARAYGQRVVGVVLPGTLRDGAVGLAAIKMRAGVTIVQDPSEALFPGMPESALNTTEVDFCLPVDHIPKRLLELTQHSFVQSPMPESESDPAAGLTCTECHGSLGQVDNQGGAGRCECRVGHAYGVDSLIAEQGEAVEAALWSAVNALQDRAATFRRLAGNPSSQVRPSAYVERAEHIEGQAEALLDLLRRLIADAQVG